MKRIILFLLVFSSSLYLITPRANALETSAKSAVLINASTGSVLYSKNSDIRLPMASTTKIMTALLLAEQNTPDKEVKITYEMVAVEGSSMGLKVGDTVTYKDLLYGLMLPSGNDAANAVAISLAGSLPKFAVLMNDKAAELGLKNTNFVTPSGLDSNNHFTSAYDLAILANHALKNEDFKKAASTKSITLTYTNPERKVTLTNHNKLLNLYEGTIGVKTGFTSSAGRCLVSAATKGNVTLVAVTLNDRNDWDDHINMLNYGFSECTDFLLSPSLPEQISVAGSNGTFVKPIAEKFSIGISRNDSITYSVNIPKFIYSPIKEGESIGKIFVYCNNEKIEEIDITAANAVNISYKTNILRKILAQFLCLLRSL